MAGDGVRTLWLLHGVNLDMLGRRDPALYGSLTLRELEEYVGACAAACGFALTCFHTNQEGAFVEKLHEAVSAGPDAVIVNPGAWTHYSYAIRDALELVVSPVAEVHLSDVEHREPWRRHSVIADVVSLRVVGKGPEGYAEAVRRLEALVRGATP